MSRIDVSIAGAILWGVLREKTENFLRLLCSFNRRGDSLGGAALCIIDFARTVHCFNRRGDSLGGAARGGVGRCYNSGVSIAGAILWGVLHAIPTGKHLNRLVSIAGAILWGVLPNFPQPELDESGSFNRRGDSLGGAASSSCWRSWGNERVSIAGAILWGVLLGMKGFYRSSL